MTLKWGSTEVTAVKWGSTNCTAVYWGSTKVWPDTFTLTIQETSATNSNDGMTGCVWTLSVKGDTTKAWKDILDFIQASSNANYYGESASPSKTPTNGFYYYNTSSSWEVTYNKYVYFATGSSSSFDVKVYLRYCRWSSASQENWGIKFGSIRRSSYSGTEIKATDMIYNETYYVYTTYTSNS